jgi:hypothetical protein
LKLIAVVLSCLCCVVVAIALVTSLRSKDPANEDRGALPPRVSGVPLNQPKAGGRQRLSGSVVNVSHLVGNEAEVSLDVNPTNPSNLVILGHSPSLQVINSFYSFDGGQSWARITIGDSEDGLSGWLRGDPSVVFDDEGNVYLAYGVRQHSPNRVTVVVGMSADGGQSYTQFSYVNTNLDIGAYPGNDKWHLATGPRPGNPTERNVYLAWTQAVDEMGSIDQRVVVSESLDAGATFSAPVTVNDASITGTSLSNSYVDPAVGPDGEVYVVWHNIILNSIYADHSLGGLVFGNDVLVTTSQTGSLRRIPAQPSRGVFAGPSIDTDRSGGPHHGRLYLVYTDLGAGGTDDIDVYVRYSDDQGSTWSSRVPVSDDGGTGSQFLPWLDVDQVRGIVGVSFYDTRNDSLNQKVEIFGAPSYDGGESFRSNLMLSAGSSDQSAGNPAAWFGNYLEYISLALHDGTASGVWSDNSTDPADLDFFFGKVSMDTAGSIAECGRGAVNLGCGLREDVLLVNGTSGGSERTIEVNAADPLVVAVGEPTSRQGDGLSTRCCIYVWLGEPGPEDVILVPKGLGVMCFGPARIATKNPKRIWNSIGVAPRLGQDNAPGPPPVIPDSGAFELLNFPEGLGRSVTVTFQGIIEDDCSQGTRPYSVTNGFVLRIVP